MLASVERVDKLASTCNLAGFRERKLSGNPEIIRWVQKRIPKNVFRQTGGEKSRAPPVKSHVRKEYMLTQSQI